MVQSIPIHSSRDFSWIRVGKLGCVDLSQFNDRQVHGPLYSNEPGPKILGFKVHSERTGTTLLFTLVKEHRDVDGDLTSIEYLSTAEGIKIVLFND